MECEQEVFDAYAATIGTALLRFNAMEAALAELLRAGHPKLRNLDIEASDAEPYGGKVGRLMEMAQQEPDAELRVALEAIHLKASRFKTERNHLAHGLLWCDPANGQPIRRFVPYKEKVADHDHRSPAEIRGVAAEFKELGREMAVLATTLRSVYPSS